MKTNEQKKVPPHTILTKHRLTLISPPTDNKVAKHCHLMWPLAGLAAQPP